MPKNGKRTYETGSYTRIDESKVRLFASAGTGLGNRRQRYSKTVVAKTDAAAERALKNFVKEVEGRSADQLTVNGLIDEFTELHVSTLAPQSQRWYADTFRRIRGALGHIQLADLKPGMIEKFYKALACETSKPFWYETMKDKDGKEVKKPLKNGLAVSTIGHHHRALAAALHWGYQKEYIATPIIDRASPPSGKKTDKRALSDAERKAFLVALDEEAARCAMSVKDAKRDVQTASWELFGRLALATGMRRGELCGLLWDDISYPKMHICHNLQSIKKEGLVLGSVKTVTSDRWLELPEDLIAQLKTWKSVQAQHALRFKLGTPKYVFTNLDGGPRDPVHVSRFFGRIFARAKIKNASLHTLRHTCVTHLLAQGAPPNDVAAYMGHASTKMTLDTYGHAQQQQAARCTMAASELLKI